MSKTKHDNDFAKLIRETIRRSGLTRGEIARRAGVPYAGLHGFVAGTRSMDLVTASRLCHVLDLELRLKSKRKGA